MDNRAYLEHVAIRVKDIHWHIRFFAEVLGMGLRALDGAPEQPRQYWTVGGLQFIHDPALPVSGADTDDTRLAHLGVMCADQEAAIEAALAWGARPMPQGKGWLRLPDGLALELIQAQPATCVAQALAINPRENQE
jgi:glyoxylase I family protein